MRLFNKLHDYRARLIATAISAASPAAESTFGNNIIIRGIIKIINSLRDYFHDKNKLSVVTVDSIIRINSLMKLSEYIIARAISR
jgi:hypothetical protein